ncbi:hypothetical protein QR680_008498 [Steinernema hermaphroditum]|uniref:Peptidase A1 domain-containing protein n=1 Tax=Steinernema hermaphroditum TaxID=289476 RepID=A0AA39IIA4_9BILA|nr:hypothetical protein QR680_008498 [Steinernema hermaphroditum]
MFRPLVVAVLLGVALAVPLKESGNIRVVRTLPSEANHYHRSSTDTYLLAFEIAIGTGLSRTAQLKLDLTSADLVVDLCYLAAGTSDSICFDPTTSRTFHRVSDILARDVISSNFPSQDNWTIPNATFVTNNYTGDPSDPNFVTSGTIGFGWPSLQKYPVTYFPLAFLGARAQKKNIFSLVLGTEGCLGRHWWGETCANYENGAPHYVPVTSQRYWQFALEGVQYGPINQPMKAQAVITSTSGYIGIPKKILSQMMSTHNITWDGLYTVYLVDCDADLPPLQFSVDGGKTLAIPREWYVSKTPLVNNLCVVNLEDSKTYGFGPDWYFGTPLLQSYCTEFDYDQKRIGFTENTYSLDGC